MMHVVDWTPTLANVTGIPTVRASETTPRLVKKNVHDFYRLFSLGCPNRLTSKTMSLLPTRVIYHSERKCKLRLVFLFEPQRPLHYVESAVIII